MPAPEIPAGQAGAHETKQVHFPGQNPLSLARLFQTWGAIRNPGATGRGPLTSRGAAGNLCNDAAGDQRKTVCRIRQE